MFVVAWLLLEVGPAFVSPFLGDDAYSEMYYLTEDWASVMLALALYSGLSYTSTILKLSAFMAVSVATLFALANLLTEALTDGWYIAFVLACVAVALVLVSIRFSFMPRRIVKPTHDTIYLVVRKPHSILDMMALIYSGIGGGFVAYHNGDIWKFKRDTSRVWEFKLWKLKINIPRRDTGRMVKERNAQYYTGKGMIDCGPATPEKLQDLDDMVDQKWSIFNNCFTVFAGWRRKWQ